MSAFERLLLAAPRQAINQAAMALAGAALLLILLIFGWLAVTSGRAGATEHDDAAHVPANEN